jgi:hypothetical protein
MAQEQYRNTDQSISTQTKISKRCCLESRSGGPSCYRKSVWVDNENPGDEYWRPIEHTA